ncbi:hypothetical protein L1987_19516 [Smallanthus sonchifolius]|uniref:Uncharacterized protein n=1 Tax=Smallanthus sonchifolius TaxID=185202 RepID=A0ACB9IQX1_9ASTR|nr:hypothetical protein L1987_19516 [Smallanthus sonchifolius]
MGKKNVMLPANQVDLTKVKYDPGEIQAPNLSGSWLRMFVMLIEMPLIGSVIVAYLKKRNKIQQMLRETVIPEPPMFRPEFPLQEQELGVVCLKEDGKSQDQVDSCIRCLPQYDPASATANRRKPVSALDGIFMAIKDDIDCYPHPSKGGTTWFDEVRTVDKDAVCVSKLRSCGVILVGKANMHEFGQGTTGNNPSNGTTRNPHDAERYTGGSSSGPAAIVASGICSAALGTDGGGSVRIPSSLCCVVGLKTTYGRTDIKGALHDGGTLEIIGPIASSVEDVMLVYAAILGASPADKLSLSPWFNDVYSPDISTKCEDILTLLSQTHGCKVVEVVIPELHQARTSHLVSIDSEALASITPNCQSGNDKKFTLDTHTNLALFRSFTASDYVAAQRLRRRVMYYHMEIFKTVDVIVTPMTGMTAPLIHTSALETGETNLKVTGNLMRFILAGNLIGLPAISVPVGYDKQGLPIGLQIIGRPWDEATILRLAAACEALRSEIKKPASYFDILKGR